MHDERESYKLLHSVFLRLVSLEESKTALNTIQIDLFQKQKSGPYKNTLISKHSSELMIKLHGRG